VGLRMHGTIPPLPTTASVRMSLGRVAEFFSCQQKCPYMTCRVSNCYV